jgi:hypothetical protein
MDYDQRIKMASIISESKLKLNGNIWLINNYVAGLQDVQQRQTHSCLSSRTSMKRRVHTNHGCCPEGRTLLARKALGAGNN